MRNYDVVVVGGGASGLAAAINAKRIHPDYSTAVLEHLPRTGKKILSTGNGRCNLTNINAKAENYRNAEFAGCALGKYGPERVTEFFSSLGLMTYADSQGRVYPRSNTAASVLDALRFETEKLGIEILNECKAEKVSAGENGFTVNGDISCGKLILACGGKASPSQGSDGSGYTLAKALSHRITPLVPALVPLNARPDAVKSLKGLRASSVSLVLEGDRNEYRSEGEILFTDNGISGIAAMELAAASERELRAGNDPVLHIDFLPEMEYVEVREYIEKVCSVKSGQLMDNLLTGAVAKQIGIAIMKNAGIYASGERVGAFSDNMTERLAESVKDFRISILGTRGFANAQVTSGGVDVRDVDPATMKSLLIDGLYICGELLDVDGGCGGFNLQWAFASGLLAGELG